MDALTKIGQFFSSDAGKAIGALGTLGGTGAGLVGNLLADKQRSDAANMAKRNALLSPAQISQQVNQATQPLNANLVQAITGNVNANLAEQGLSQAPGIISSTLAQALAGPEQQQQQQALQIVMAKLGLPAEYAKLIPPNANMGPAIAALMKALGSFPGGGTATSPTGGAAGSFPTMPYPTSTGGPMPFPIVPPTGPAWNPGLQPPPYSPDQPPDLGSSSFPDWSALGIGAS